MEKITLPPELIPKNTRDSQNSYKELMTRYDRISEEYKNDIISNECDFNMENNNQLEIYTQENVLNYFAKAKNEMDKIKQFNNHIFDSIKEYETFKTETEEFMKLINKANEIYYTLSKKSQNKNIKNKLTISENILLSIENKSNIENFLFDIEQNIYELNNKFINSNAKLAELKNLLIKCISDEKINYNMCNVCLTNKINICINPCGHTFCSDCVDKMNFKCGMCRCNIGTKIKIYIDNDSEIQYSRLNDNLLDGWQNQNSIAINAENLS